MNDAGVIIASYVTTLAGIGAYTAWVLHRARRVAAQVRDEDRPWT